MKILKFKNIVIVTISCLLLVSCNKTYDRVSRYIAWNCDFKDSVDFFMAFDSIHFTNIGDSIDLRKALKIDYDTLYLISVGFESDISDLIGCPYHGGDFTLESESKNLLLLVKNNKVVYQDKIKKMLGKVNFSYDVFGHFSLPYILKHSSSIYYVSRQKDGLRYIYYLYNVEKNKKND